MSVNFTLVIAILLLGISVIATLAWLLRLAYIDTATANDLVLKKNKEITVAKADLASANSRVNYLTGANQEAHQQIEMLQLRLDTSVIRIPLEVAQVSHMLDERNLPKEIVEYQYERIIEELIAKLKREVDAGGRLVATGFTLTVDDEWNEGKRAVVSAGVIPRFDCEIGSVMTFGGHRVMPDEAQLSDRVIVGPVPR